MSLRIARPSPHQGLLVSNTLLPHHGRPWGPLHTRGVPPPAIRSERHQTCAQTSVTPSASPNPISATGHQNMLGQGSRTRHSHALGSLLHGVLRVYVRGRIHRQVNSRGGPGDMPFSPGCGSGQPHQPLHGASAPETEQHRPLQAWGTHLPWPHRFCPTPSGGYFGLLRHTPSHSPELIITVGHRPFPVPIACAAGQFSFPVDKMAERKRCGSLGENSSASKRSKRQVTVPTCEKWQREFDRDYQTLLWLRNHVDTANRSLVDTLWCWVCRTYQARIRYKRNFSAVWVTGSTDYKSSNIADHGKSEQHITCMAYMRADSAKARNKPVESYTPIARSLLPAPTC